MQCVSECVKDFYDHSKSKFYGEIKPNGNGLATVLLDLVLSMNCKDKVNVSSIVDRSVK